MTQYTHALAHYVAIAMCDLVLALVFSIMSLAVASLMEHLVSWASRYLDTRHLYGIPLG